MNTAIGGPSQFRGLSWLAGTLATVAAAVIAAVLAVVAAATVLFIAVMGAALLTLAGVAMNARRAVRARRTPAKDAVIEARNVGGHSWVAYGWDRSGR